MLDGSYAHHSAYVDLALSVLVGATLLHYFCTEMHPIIFDGNLCQSQYSVDFSNTLFFNPFTERKKHGNRVGQYVG